METIAHLAVIYRGLSALLFAKRCKSEPDSQPAQVCQSNRTGVDGDIVLFGAGQGLPLYGLDAQRHDTAYCSQQQGLAERAIHEVV